MEPLQPDLASMDHAPNPSLEVIKYSAGPRREEQTAYFKYIVDHWENLPPGPLGRGTLAIGIVNVHNQHTHTLVDNGW